MKASTKIITWIAVSLILQCSVYLYLDKWYFAPESNIKFTQMSTEDKSKVIKPNVTLSGYAKDISVSYDCSYTAYILDNKVTIVNTSTGKQRKIDYSDDVKCLSYKWLPDSNIMMIAERLNYNGRKVIRFYSYDAEKQEKKDTDNYEGGRHKVNYMLSNSANDTVDFQISSLTGVLYGKISYNKTNARIYRIDRNEELTRVDTYATHIGNTAVASDDDQLAYEDLASGRIRTNYKGKTISINGISNMALLGTDSDDNFYVGNARSRVSRIYYGKLSEKTSSWKELNLSTEADSNDIFITENGGMFLLKKSENAVVNIKKNTNYKFNGKFIQVNDNSIVYEENNKLKLKSIK